MKLLANTIEKCIFTDNNIKLVDRVQFSIFFFKIRLVTDSVGGASTANIIVNNLNNQNY